MFQEQVGLLKADVIRIQRHVETAMNSAGSKGTIASCLREVFSISDDLQRRIHVFLVDFDLQLFLASKEKPVAGSNRLRVDRERNDTL